MYMCVFVYIYICLPIYNYIYIHIFSYRHELGRLVVGEDERGPDNHGAQFALLAILIHQLPLHRAFRYQVPVRE